MSAPVAVEVCVQDPAGAAVALAAGATRVELCAALDLGGLTPSAASIEATRALTTLPGRLHILVRPRPGGYVYTTAEIDLICADVAWACAAGADGVVVGSVTARGGIDVGQVRAVLDAAGGREVTFHRAVDVVADRLTALETLATLGVTRILTSGGAARAVDGAAELGALVRASAGRVQVMGGGGVRPEHVPTLLGAGVDAIHLSAQGSPSPHAGDAGPGGSGLARSPDGDVVAAVVRAVRSR